MSSVATIAIVIAAVLCLAIGVAASWFVGQALARARKAQFDSLAGLGRLYWSDKLFHVSLGVLCLGGAVVGLAIVPIVAWIGGQDTGARDAAFRLAIAGTGILVLAVLTGLPGWRVFILRNDRLVSRRFGSEHEVFYDRITKLADANHPPRLRVKSSDGRSLTIHKSLRNYEDFVNRVRRRAHHADVTPSRNRFTRVPTAHSPGEPCSYRVNPIHLASQLVRRGQPTELHLGASIRYRSLRGEITERLPTELFSASVEPDMSGGASPRHELCLRFTDGSALRIDDSRARQFRSTTEALGADVRLRYLQISSRTTDDRARSDLLLNQAASRVAENDVDGAIAVLKESIARFPDQRRLQQYSQIGDLHSTLGDHEAAASAYRAHIDFFPNDIAGWHGLAGSLQAAGHEELAAEAAKKLQQVTPNGTALRRAG